MEYLVDFLLNFYGPAPYFLIFGILLACGFGFPLPEDIILFSAGLLAYYGLTDLWGMIAVCFFGVILGDSIIFFLGTKYGRQLTQKWFFHKLLPDKRLNAVQKRFHEEGNKLIFAARFMPGLRAAVFFSAGTLHLPFRVFFLYDSSAALLSVPTIVFIVYWFGDELDWVVGLIQRIEHGIFFVIVAILLAVVGKWYLTHRKLKRS